MPSVKSCSRRPAPGACFELEGCARIGYACDSSELKAGLAAISQTLDTL